MTTPKVRVRFAPSPTGYLHVGGARSALFNWFFARHHSGAFIVRIEDTDRARLVPDSLVDILDELRWLGLDWDEGPEAFDPSAGRGLGGPYGSYIQSERLAIYQEHARMLIERGYAYHCYCSPARLEALRAQQVARKEPPGYDRRCRDLTTQEIAAYRAQGVVPVVRLKVPLQGITRFRDAIRGEIQVENRALDDIVLLKSDGYPTYHLANVVDDHLMEITHILRADEWLPSVPKHVIMYQGFSWEPPVFAHLPVVLSPTGKGKMSKRFAGAGENIFVREFRQEGYLPEAMINFLALLGWAWDDRTELFSRDELIEKFDLANIKPSPAKFDYEKLEWMNGYYIRQLDADDLTARLVPFLERPAERGGLPADVPRPIDRGLLRRLVPLIRERIKTLSEVVELIDFFFREDIEYDPQLLVGKEMSPQRSWEALSQSRARLEKLTTFEEASLESTLRALADELGLKAGQLFSILRVAVTGKTVAPPLFGTLAVLGRERSLQRIDAALARLREMLAVA